MLDSRDRVLYVSSVKRVAIRKNLRYKVPIQRRYTELGLSDISQRKYT